MRSMIEANVMDEDWAVFLTIMPDRWRELARETEALKGLRKNKSEGDLPAFVQEDQPRWIEPVLEPPPRPARPRKVGAVLLAGAERLFFKVSPILSSTL
jgi:hypothetical protein